MDFINIKNLSSGKDTVETSCSEWNNAICSNMDGSRDYHPKWSEVREIPYDITYVYNLKIKMIQMNLFTKQKQTQRLRKQMYGY